MVGPGASLQRVIREGFSKEVTFDPRPEDEKETGMCRLFQGIIFALFHAKALRKE